MRFDKIWIKINEMVYTSREEPGDVMILFGPPTYRRGVLNVQGDIQDFNQESTHFAIAPTTF